MQILIKEENGFMPTTKIFIADNKIVVEENNKEKTLKYEKEQIKEIIDVLVEMTKGWKTKYIDSKIIDDEIYTITIMGKVNKEIYIKNAYPNNWDKFIVFRNHLVKETLEI